MAYPDHALLQLSGVFGSGVNSYEVWSTGLRFIVSVGAEAGGSTATLPTVAELEAFLDANEAELSTGLENSGLFVGGNTVRLQTVKFNAIDATGHYAYDETVAREFPDLPFGSATTPIVYPTQVSKVLTLETGYTRGVASRGRMYIPGPVNAFNSATGTLTVNQSEVDAWAAWIAGLETTLVGADRTVTFAPAVVSGIGTGFGWRLVTGVSMDNRADIQRRRANDIQGTRLSADLV